MMSEQDKQEAAQTPVDEQEDAQAPSDTDVILELEDKLGQAREQTLRLAAELENVKKRSIKAESDAKRYAVTRFAEDILGVSDNLYRALDALPDDARDQAGPLFQQLLEGVEMTQSSLQGAMERHGIKQIAAKGEKFDPAQHQAVAQIPSPDTPQGHVAEVIQRGYQIGDRTLRAAVVAVSTGAPAGAAPAQPAPGDAPEPGSRVDTKA